MRSSALTANTIPTAVLISHGIHGVARKSGRADADPQRPDDRYRIFAGEIDRVFEEEGDFSGTAHRLRHRLYGRARICTSGRKPKATIWCGDIDDEITAKGYIVPGLGDAGDLAFGSNAELIIF